MKKTLLTSVMLAAAVVSFCAVNNAPANATCPAKTDCVQQRPFEHHPERCMKPMSPQEHAKMMEAKKAEFEARLNLTAEQKAKIEQLKADENKALKSCRAKIKKEHEKLDKLVAQEMETRAENVKKFEAILTEEQKAELKKMHEEMMAEKAKFVPCSCDCGCPECAKHHDAMKGHHKGPRGPHHGLQKPEISPADTAVQESAPASEQTTPAAPEATATETPVQPAAVEEAKPAESNVEAVEPANQPAEPEAEKAPVKK